MGSKTAQTTLIFPIRENSSVGYEVLANGCWQWRGAVAPNGYGRVGVPRSRTTAQAHVYLWERVNGPKPTGVDLDHLCRNRACVNPQHLELVSRAENCRRGAKAKLTYEDVAAILQDERTQGAIAVDYGVHSSTISRIKTGDRGTWR